MPPRASDDPEEKRIFRDLWYEKTQREIVLESLKTDCEIRTGRPAGPLRYRLTDIGGGCLCGGIRGIS